MHTGYIQIFIRQTQRVLKGHQEFHPKHKKKETQSSPQTKILMEHGVASHLLNHKYRVFLPN